MPNDCTTVVEYVSRRTERFDEQKNDDDDDDDEKDGSSVSEISLETVARTRLIHEESSLL